MFVAGTIVFVLCSAVGIFMINDARKILKDARETNDMSEELYKKAGEDYDSASEIVSKAKKGLFYPVVVHCINNMTDEMIHETCRTMDPLFELSDEKYQTEVMSNVRNVLYAVKEVFKLSEEVKFESDRNDSGS